MANFNIRILIFSVMFLFVNTEEELNTEVLQAPPADCARKAKNDDIIFMHYIGKLDNGNQFDNSYTHTPKEPFQFKLGAGQVIAGWEEGVVGMCVGEKRKLTIPPSLGYGDEGYGDLIPSKSILIFEVELMDIKDDDGSFEEGLDIHDEHAHAKPHDFEHIDINDDKQISKEELISFINKLNNEGKEKVEDVAKTVDEIIKEHDINNDGMISFEENQHFAENQDYDHHDPHEHHHAFETIDIDNDKFISTEEMKTYLLKFYEDKEEKADIDKDVKDIFDEHDADKDGKISLDENQHAAAKLDEAEALHAEAQALNAESHVGDEGHNYYEEPGHQEL